MAVATFAERIQDDLTVLIADQTLIDLSRQRDATATQDVPRTLRVSQMAASKVESVLGDVGSYDDTDGTIGDQQALDYGIRIALLYYSQMYTLTMTDAGQAMQGGVLEELENLAVQRRQTQGTPVVKNRDNDAFNARHDGPLWPDDDDTDAP